MHRLGHFSDYYFLEPYKLGRMILGYSDQKVIFLKDRMGFSAALERRPWAFRVVQRCVGIALLLPLINTVTRLFLDLLGAKINKTLAQMRHDLKKHPESLVVEGCVDENMMDSITKVIVNQENLRMLDLSQLTILSSESKSLTEILQKSKITEITLCEEQWSLLFLLSRPSERPKVEGINIKIAPSATKTWVDAKKTLPPYEESEEAENELAHTTSNTTYAANQQLPVED